MLMIIIIISALFSQVHPFCLVAHPSYLPGPSNCIVTQGQRNWIYRESGGHPGNSGTQGTQDSWEKVAKHLYDDGSGKIELQILLSWTSIISTRPIQLHCSTGPSELNLQGGWGAPGAAEGKYLNTPMMTEVAKLSCKLCLVEHP